MWLLKKPSPDTVRKFLEDQTRFDYSYPEVGASLRECPPGYKVDHRRVCLGKGTAVFEAAHDALRRWQMFELGWVELCWPETPPKPGAVVAILARACGLWCLNACRVVYEIDETQPCRRVGFAYGTLKDHAGRGEERFTVELRADGAVWYDLLAFSRPGHWLFRVAYPIARMQQRRFGRDSLAAMTRAVASVGPCTTGTPE